jgi:hypothetical protein
MHAEAFATKRRRRVVDAPADGGGGPRLEDDVDECPICLFALDADVVLVCGPSFHGVKIHRSCTEDWTQTQADCRRCLKKAHGGDAPAPATTDAEERDCRACRGRHVRHTCGKRE